VIRPSKAIQNSTSLRAYCRLRYDVEVSLTDAVEIISHVPDNTLQTSDQCAEAWIKNALSRFPYFCGTATECITNRLTVEIHLETGPKMTEDEWQMFANWLGVFSRSPNLSQCRLSKELEILTPINKVASRVAPTISLVD